MDGSVKSAMRRFDPAKIESLKARFSAQYDGYTLSSCTIDTASLDELHQQRKPDTSTGENSQSINLDFLNDLLRRELGNESIKDTFIPADGPLLIRACMREIWQLLFEKLHFGAAGQTTLIGSPGVGASIFFFLAAVHMARTKTVAFLRRSRASCYVSAFIMQSSSSSRGGVGDGCNAASTNVDVLFIRDYKKDTTTAGSLAFFDGLATIVLGSSKFGEFVKFVDGPYYKEVPVFNFLCTSDGRPLFKSDEGDQYCFVLDGWTRDEAVSALGLQGINKEKANEAYMMCGGSIRAMIEACRDDTTIHQRVSELIQVVKNRNVVIRSLDFHSTSRGKDLKTQLPDDLLTMFRNRASDADSDKRMAAIQYVDSSFALQKLAEILDIALFQDGYELAIVMKNQTQQDVFYGLLVHKCVESLVHQQSALVSRCIRKVCWSKGAGAQGVKELAEGGVYWIPSMPNFSVVDAAIVAGGRFLHAFQYTVAKKDPFDRARFDADFLRPILDKFDTLSGHVMVHCVAPTNGGWKLPSDYVFDYNPIDTAGAQTRKRNLLVPYNVFFHEYKLEFDKNKDALAACMKCLEACFTISANSTAMRRMVN